MNTLFLRLEGPLQAWGIRSQWGERDTADAPTKSGVIGLLGCALGLKRGDDNLHVLSEAFRFGVRVDRPGQLLTDYHTTGGGTFGAVRHDGSGTRYTDQPYAGGVPSAEVNKRGQVKVKITSTTGEPETDTSTRFYLADASFLAALQGDSEFWIERLASALQNPVWPYFLGRKACVPTQPVFVAVGDFDDLASALQSQPVAERSTWPLRALVETTVGQGIRQNDHIIVPSHRVFGPRYVQEILLSNPSDTSTPLNTLEG